MITPSRSSPQNVGHRTGFVLGLVVFICLIMIGCAGYLKTELDQAEAILAAPDAAINSDQESFDKLRRSLGYSGFVGLAQNFAMTHDPAALPDMRSQLKTANDLITRLPDRTSSEVRHDLQFIATTFDEAYQKAEKSTSDTTVTFNGSDMLPLYAALPVLDARITSAAAVNRLNAQTHLQFWAMLLMFVSWGSLIIASAMSVGIYLSLRDRNSAPLRALVQSVKNMAHGDMHTSIWGMERADTVGELARTVDLARYHFSQLPDMSLLSDQGPVRIRFEGNTKSMFEAMMHLITRDSEQVRAQATSLSEAVTNQQKMIAQMSAQIEGLLHNILERGQDGNQQIRHVLQDMMGSAQSLKNAQEHAADQLNRIVPFLQERAQGIAEITQITGKQVSQVLQSLIITERAIKTSADQSDEAIKKLSSTADDLGGRLFGAVNLLQASGKVLAETTESTQSRLNEAIERLSQTVVPAPTPHMIDIPGDAPSKEETDLAPRIEIVIKSLEATQKQLENRLDEQTQAAKAQIDLLTTHSTSLLAQTATTTQTLSSAADHLRGEQAKFDETVTNISGKLNSLGERLEHQANEAFTKMGERSTQPEVPQDNTLLTSIGLQIAELNEKLSSLDKKTMSAAREVTPQQAATSNNLLLEIKSGFETTVRSLTEMREQLTNLVINVQTQVPQALPSSDNWQIIAGQIETTRITLTQQITQQIDRIEMRLNTLNSKVGTAEPNLPRDAQEQMEQQTQILTELVATLGVLDAHMQQLKTDMNHARRS